MSQRLHRHDMDNPLFMGRPYCHDPKQIPEVERAISPLPPLSGFGVNVCMTETGARTTHIQARSSASHSLFLLLHN